MKKNLYLHIGNFKTGSTSLQRFLYLNKEKLKKKNIDVIYEKNFFKGTINNLKLFKYIDNYDLYNTIKYLKNSKKNLIISSEYFSCLSYDYKKLNFLKKIMKNLGYNIKIIFFYRDDLSYLYSFYREVIASKKIVKNIDNIYLFVKKIKKNGFYFYKKNNYLNYNYYFNNKKIINNWKKVFKNFFPIHFNKENKNKIYHDLTNFLSLENDYLKFPIPLNTKKTYPWHLKRIAQKFFLMIIQMTILKKIINSYKKEVD